MSKLICSLTGVVTPDTLVLELTPGYQELSAAYGLGKSRTIEAVREACTEVKKYSTTLSWDLATDAEPAVAGLKKKTVAQTGSVTVPGVDGADAGLSLTPTSVRRKKGAPNVRLLNESHFVGLWRPGKATEDAARQQELETFAAITGVQASATDLIPAELLPYAAIPAAGLITAMQSEASKALHAAKRQKLVDVEALDRKITVCAGQADPVDTTAPLDLNAAAARRDELEAAFVELRVARAAREATEASRREMRALHADEPPSLDAVDQEIVRARGRAELLDASAARVRKDAGEDPKVDALQEEHAVAADAVAAGLAQIEDMRRELAKLEGQQVEREKQRDACKTRLDAAQKRNADWLAAMETAREATAEAERLRTGLPSLEQQRADIERQRREWQDREDKLKSDVQGPTSEEMDAAKQELDQAQEDAKLAKRQLLERERATEEATLRLQREKAQALADQLEEAATSGLQDRVQAVLEKASIKGWSIQGGVLCALSPRRKSMVVFHLLSSSEKAVKTLELMLAHRQETDKGYTALFLPQEVGDGMIAEQKREVSAWARGANVHILSASAAENDALTLVQY